MSNRRPSLLHTVCRVLEDVVILVRLSLAPRARLAAENLFLRKQLALFQERRAKPRRLDPATRVTLVLLSRNRPESVCSAAQMLRGLWDSPT